MNHGMNGRKKIRLFVSAMLLLATWCAAPPALAQSAQGGDFAKAYQEFRASYLGELRRAGFVGSSFYFVRDNRVVAKELYGLADAERGVPVDEETIYH